MTKASEEREPFHFTDKTPEEWEALERENEERLQREREFNRAKIIEEIRPKAFGETDPNRLAISAEKMEKVLNWNPKGRKGLLLFGATGGGKTRLIWLLLTKLIEEGGWRPLYFTADKLARDLATSYKQSWGHEQLMEKLFKWRIVVIDDLGKEKPTERMQEDLFAIVRERTDQHRPLIITTNFVGDGLVDRYPDQEMAKPMLRRLREFCEMIQIGGEP